MTATQENQINKVRKHIADIREILDGIMYYSEPISVREHNQLREAYDLVCKANDKL